MRTTESNLNSATTITLFTDLKPKSIYVFKMKHKTLSKESLENNKWFVEIELMPENDFEAKAIRNVETGSSTNEEMDMVENYLISSLNGMSIINLVRQKGNVFAVTATM
jgi:hypothetical protein